MPPAASAAKRRRSAQQPRRSAAPSIAPPRLDLLLPFALPAAGFRHIVAATPFSLRRRCLRAAA